MSVASLWRPFAAICNCNQDVDDKQDVADAQTPVSYTVDVKVVPPDHEAGLALAAREIPPRGSESGAASDLRNSINRLSNRSSRTVDPADEAAGHKKRDSRTGLELPEKRSSVRSMDSSRFASNNSEGQWASEIDAANLIEIDNEFDFFDPTTKEMQVMKMGDVQDDVLHTRGPKTTWGLKRLLFGQSSSSVNTSKDDAKDDVDANNAEDSQSNASNSPHGSVQSDCESEGSDGEAQREPSSPTLSSGSGSNVSRTESNVSTPAGDQKKPALTKQKSYFDADNVTNWGTLVAKILRRRVQGLTGAITRTMHKRRHTLRSSNALPQQYVLPSVQARAQFVVERTRLLAKRVGQEQVDQFDANWIDDTLLSFLFGEDFVDTLMLLANTVRKVVASQPVLAECGVPCRVFGDIHGQLRDLLILFRTFGTPGDRKNEGGQSVSFVFNGDFVDRGSHSLEVVGLLFAMKIMLPEKVFLVRGNHEDRAMNERYGFENECYTVLGADVGPKTYELIHRAFDELPLACLINDKVLVVHGGLGDGKFALNDIRGVERPLKERQLSNDPMVWNMLWSDPIEDDKAADQEGIFGVHQSPRSSTGLFKFGWNVTKTFCAANGLGLVIRSHQSKAGSLGFSVMHDRMLVRVFSARDYEEHGNDGAVLLITNQTDKNPFARQGSLLVRPQVVRSVTKGAGKKRVTRRKKRRGSIGPSFNMKEMELPSK